MKLVVAIVQDYDVDGLLRAVVASGLGATRLASTGGFLRTGNTTVLMAVDDHRAADCLKLVHQTCGRRVAVPDERLPPGVLEMYGLGIDRTFLGGGVVVVASMCHFERL